VPALAVDSSDHLPCVFWHDSAVFSGGLLYSIRRKSYWTAEYDHFSYSIKGKHILSCLWDFFKLKTYPKAWLYILVFLKVWCTLWEYIIYIYQTSSHLINNNSSCMFKICHFHVINPRDWFLLLDRSAAKSSIPIFL